MPLEGGMLSVDPSLRSWASGNPGGSHTFDRLWDKPVVPMPQHDRQLLSEADVRRLIEVLAVSTLFL